MAADSSTKQRLLERINDRSAVVGVIGLGYVGLPLAVEFAKAGFRVIGYDVSERVVSLLSAGESHIQDVPSEEVAALVKSGKFEATTDEKRLAETDAISIAVPTPLSKTRDPDMSYVLSAADTAMRQAHKACSSCWRARRIRARRARFSFRRSPAAASPVGEDVFAAFSPERVDPGNRSTKRRTRRKSSAE
jgi:UDP-N-acetyl-D-glucosamine dehydrogenase